MSSCSSKFSFSEVTRDIALANISKIRSAGPDGISPRLYKVIIDYSIDPLVDIINCSFRTGTFPESVKRVVITPLPKVDCPNRKDDYRPVCRADFIVKVQ